MVAPAWNIVDTSYFATLRIPLLSGRDFAPTDVIGAPPVVIVSDALARRLWPGENAVGKTVRLAIGGPHATQHVATVIGVAGDIRSSSLIDGLAEPYAYLALAQSSATAGPDLTTQMSIVVRHRGDTSVAPAISAIVHEIDPRLVVARVESLDDAVAMGLTPQRVLATIGAASGLVGLLLASMGIYGVTAYSVSLRRREFAIRLALGAPRARVVRMVLRQGATLVTLGLAVGLLLGIGAAQALAVFFYGLPAGHLPTLVGTALLFFAIGGAASLVPAGQAVRDGWRRALQED
jgi:ABC-type antimicrobial peptide transport system permease subunit